MFSVCAGCGAWNRDFNGAARDDDFEVRRDSVRHRTCGHEQALVRRPLLGICGASGAGKTTLAIPVARRLRRCVVLEGDLLWLPGMDTPEDGYLRLVTSWLAFAIEIAQGGHPLALFGAQTPGRWERNALCRYVGSIRYLALVCDDDVLRCRLQARPTWRKSSSDQVVAKMLDYNAWFKSNAQPLGFDLLDTTNLPVGETMQLLIDWIEAHP